MNTNSTPFIHSICYNKTKIRFSRGETEGERSGESDSRCLKLFPWETGSFPLGSNGRRRAQGTLYTRGLIETARHCLGRKSNESPNVQSHRRPAVSRCWAQSPRWKPDFWCHRLGRYCYCPTGDNSLNLP